MWHNQLPTYFLILFKWSDHRYIDIEIACLTWKMSSKPFLYIFSVLGSFVPTPSGQICFHFLPRELLTFIMEPIRHYHNHYNICYANSLVTWLGLWHLQIIHVSCTDHGFYWPTHFLQSFVQYLINTPGPNDACYRISVGELGHDQWWLAVSGDSALGPDSI